MNNGLPNKPRRKTKFNIYELNLVIIFTGYPIISFLPDLLHVDSRLITVPFRFLALLIAIITLFVGVNNKNFYKKSLITKLVIVFFVLYLLKIISNLIFGPEVNYALSKEEYVFWAAGVCLIPMLSVAYIQTIDFTRVAKRIIYVLSAVLWVSIFNNKDALQSTIDTRINANSALNTISYGHLGVSLSLLSLFFLEFKWKKIFYFFSFILGGYIMLISGSRSPVIAFVCCLVFVALVRRNKWVIGGLIGFGIIIVSSFAVFVTYLKQVNPVIVDRLVSMITDKNQKEERNGLYNDAIDDFLQNPVTGKHFLLSHGLGSGFYPHNLIIEAFMAVGLVGGCLFVYLITRTLIACVKLLRKNYSFSWVPLLFIQSLILGLASGSLWGSQVVWVTMTIIFSIYDNQRYLARKNKFIKNLQTVSTDVPPNATLTT